jgi:hypothetical protein
MRFVDVLTNAIQRLLRDRLQRSYLSADEELFPRHDLTREVWGGPGLTRAPAFPCPPISGSRRLMPLSGARRLSEDNGAGPWERARALTSAAIGGAWRLRHSTYAAVARCSSLAALLRSSLIDCCVLLVSQGHQTTALCNRERFLPFLLADRFTVWRLAVGQAAACVRCRRATTRARAAA